MQSEKALTNVIIELLNYSGKYFCWKVNSGFAKLEKGGMIKLARAGTSDIQGIRKKDGKMICIECKLPGKEKNLTQLQNDYLLKMKEYGALTGMATNTEQALRIAEGK